MADDSDKIISYSRNTLWPIPESGFYYNEDSKWFEVWWNKSDMQEPLHDKDIILIATSQYLNDVDILFMEALAYWSGRMDEVLEKVTWH